MLIFFFVLSDPEEHKAHLATSGSGTINRAWSKGKKVITLADSQGGKFRHKKSDFTIVSNAALLDTNLSYRAKGLYCMIQHYVTMENFVLYKNFLIKQSTEGKSAFDTAWKELKDAGYLIQYQTRNEKNRIFYEYELLDNPADSVTRFSVHGNSVDRNSVDGKSVCIINNKKNNIIQNNIIQNKATAPGSQSARAKEPKVKKNSFHNFTEREYDYQDLQDRLIDHQRKKKS